MAIAHFSVFHSTQFLHIDLNLAYKIYCLLTAEGHKTTSLNLEKKLAVKVYLHLKFTDSSVILSIR